MRVILVFSVFLLVSCSESKKISPPNPPTDWKMFSQSTDSNLSIHEKSVQTSENKWGKFTKFWVLNNQVLKNDKGLDSESSTKSFWVLECTNKKIRLERSIKYSRFNGDGEVISDTGTLYGSTLEPIVPQTLGETYYEIFCNSFK